MPRSATSVASVGFRVQKKPVTRDRRAEDALVIARQQGLFEGGRTQTVRGRMPKLLVSQAKKRTGIQSDSKLIELALANLAVADDYGDWLLSQRGSVSREIELEF